MFWDLVGLFGEKPWLPKLGNFRESKKLSCECSFSVQTHQPHTTFQPFSLWRSHTQGLPPLFWSPQGRVKLFKLANLKPACGSPILSCENHNSPPRDVHSCLHSPLTSILLTSSIAPIIGAGISSLRNCEKQFSFQGQLSPDLLASPFLNNNKL